MYHVNDYGYYSNKSKNIEQFHDDMAATSVHSKLMTYGAKNEVLPISHVNCCLLRMSVRSSVRQEMIYLSLNEGETIFTVCDLSVSLDQLIVLQV